MTSPVPYATPATIAPVEPVVTAAAEPEPERFERAGVISDRLVDNIETVVYGKRSEIKLVLTALACDGHVLLEDVPGTAKTVLARAIAGSIEGAIPQRIQCTPDLQPTDVTGLSVFDQQTRGFEFRPGPIFANVVLVDEINRATPKTQSALLEAMAERQVTVDGVTRELPYPFLVLATENPIEYEGTFPLPEAQLDRFFLRASLGYPGSRGRAQDPRRPALRASRSKALQPVVGLDEVHELRAAAQHVYVDNVLHRWVVELVRATREQESVVIGSSVRGSLALERAARAWALLDGRSYVVPEDIERLFVPVLVHRVVFTSGLRRACPSRQAGQRRSRSSAPSCLELAPASRLRRGSPVRGRGSDPAGLTRDGPRAGRSADVSARPASSRDRALVRDDEEPEARLGTDVAGLASVPARRRHRRDRLGGIGAVVHGEGQRRVRGARALRRGSAEGHHRL